jgi:TfoX/Sxy family transcriptional regulator of competence genes
VPGKTDNWKEPAMTAEREALADRVRTALPPDRPVREVSMFGGLSFMVDDSMVVAARRDGDLLVRIDPARNEELLSVPGAKPAVMGADRPMGPGWITISHDGLTTDEQLAFWIHVGLEHRAAQAKSHPGSGTR